VEKWDKAVKTNFQYLSFHRTQLSRSNIKCYWVFSSSKWS